MPAIGGGITVTFDPNAFETFGLTFMVANGVTSQADANAKITAMSAAAVDAMCKTLFKNIFIITPP